MEFSVAVDDDDGLQVVDEGGSWWTKRGNCKTKAGWPPHLQLTKKERVLITDMQLRTARSLSEAKLEQISFHPNTI